jgi:hypothetical protein
MPRSLKTQRKNHSLRVSIVFGSDRDTARGQTPHYAPITSNTTQKARFEGGDRGDQDDQGTTPQKNEGVGVVSRQ